MTEAKSSSLYDHTEVEERPARRTGDITGSRIVVKRKHFKVIANIHQDGPGVDVKAANV
jgi:hypothetical protein